MYRTTRTFLLAATAFLVACSQHGFSIPYSDDGVSAGQPKDLPVPSGMRLLDRYHQSHSRESGSYRYAHMVYEGSLPMARVASYLLENLPAREYQFQSKESLGHEHEVLHFTRGPYSLECTIRRKEAVTRLEYDLRFRPKR